MNPTDPFKSGRSGPYHVFVPFLKAEVSQSISDRFERQVRLHPSRVAIGARGKLFSYGNLNQLANQIAWTLLNCSGDAQERIALLLDETDLIRAILGVLKAGHIYVPLDPFAPKIRNRFILHDADASLVLTNTRNLELATELASTKVRVINLDNLEVDLPGHDPGLAISSNAIAYIIYTSGSTGQPKGVVENHRNLLHNVMTNTNMLRISCKDRISLLRSVGAGGAARDALSALLNGAALYPFSVRESGLQALTPWLMDEEITIFTTIITVFRHLGAVLSGAERFPALRIIYVGGEQVTKRDVELYKKYFSDDCLFVNRLGITETGTVAYFFINKNSHFTTAAVPVGYPAEDTEILILDESGKEILDHAVGEIAIKSEYISPGYWRRPDLTESVFLTDPAGGEKRIYRSGDVGRKLADGCLVHLGWKDFHVNVRGYRIDVTEVEAQLLEYPDVLEAIVVGREHPSGEIRLAAAVVPVQKSTVNIENLRCFLKGGLPDYMIPSAFMVLDALPLGPNGKTDRRSLPPPEWLPSQDVRTVVRPRNELEEMILGIWAAILDLEFIGVRDNFFDLGGHSLLLGQVMSRVQTALGVDVRLDRFFEEPTVEVLAELVQRALEADQNNTVPLVRVSRAESIRLSFAQERIWFLHQLEPNNLSYNFSTATLIEGPLAINTLESALNEVIKRHEALRTAVTIFDGPPAQLIIPELKITLPVIGLPHLTRADVQAEILRVVAEFAQQPFDLSAAPLFRFLLLKLNDNTHVFITVHHLVADAWSIGVLFNEISAFYHQYTTKLRVGLPEPPVQYADFAAWQRHWLQGERLEAEASHWKQQLGKELTPGELPGDRPRPQRQSFRGGRCIFELPKHLVSAIKRLSIRESATLYMLLLGAFKVLLFRYTGQEDIVLGSPVAARSRNEIQNLIGLFTNTLLLRTDLRDNPNFVEVLKRIRQTCLKAYAHQHFPFEKLVENLQPKRDLSRNPLFQVMFVLQNTPNPVLTLDGLTTQRLEIDSGTSKFDLTLALSEQRNEDLIGSFEYSSDLFDGATIDRMAAHYRRLLEAIVADPEQPIAALPMLTEAERRQIVVEWNDTAADYPKDKCIHQLFEEQVERTPDAIAVEFEDQQITYAELNRRANQLAHYLISLGIGPEKFVGICVERSIEMVVGLLGILKAGCAYVPLDPSYPEERLRFMLDDADIAVLLTQESLLGRTQNSTLSSQPLALCLDRDWPLIAQQAGDNPDTTVNSENLAYVIYTSGSTGKPKGVQIEHRSVINCLYSLRDRLRFNEHDVLLAVTTIAFDISVLELFLPLFIGGKVVVAGRDQAADGSALVNILTNSRITALQATPSTWRLLLEAGWEGSQGFKVLCGGEALPRDLAEALLGRGEVWNLYGPTESTIWSTVHKLESGEGPVLIGRPLANTKIYILDSHLQPVPIGVHGDLYIGGDGLARGYCNNPELTTERFIPDPLSDKAHAGLYRTGDRARYRLDGNIEFLGRTDTQVKIRGHRIELGEIESVLTQHPAVKQTVVVAFDKFAHNSENPKSVLSRAKGFKTGAEQSRSIENPKSLVAYVVSQDQPQPTVSELRQFLQGKLPDYMIPSLFLFLDTLPLTSNGKLDRNALPPPDGDRPLLDQGFVEPRTEIDELVAQVWREVLKRDEIGVYDNFFDLGGHSLLATRVVARLRTGFNIDLPLRKLFELPTVAGLAEHIEILRRSENAVSIPPILPVPRDREIPLSFSQQRLWFLRQLDPGATAYNMLSIFALHGPLSVPVLEQAINAVIVLHEILRTVFPEKDGKPVQVILPFLEITVPVIDLGDIAEPARETKAHELALTEARQPFDLRAGPLLRAKILALAEQDFYILLNVDHMILDATSMVVFFKEIAACYEAIVDEGACALAPPAVQYADYAVWQREDIPDESLNAQLEYWKRQFDSWLPQAELPADHGRPPVQTWRGARLTKNLSRELTAGLKVLSRREGVTLFMTLLAAFDIIVARHTGSEDIVVGSTIAGRGRPEIENLIGFFINALPLRVDLAGNPTFTALLKRVREVCLDAYTHQELPFERIVEAINPQRDLSRNPLFQILFNLVDTSDRVLPLRGCEVTRQSFFDREAKFDLTLYAPEKDGAIELAIVYNTDLFSAERMAPMLDQYAHLLAQIATEPEKAIGEYDLVTPKAGSVLPDPTAPLDSGWVGAIHDLFSRHAENSPARLAVSDALGDWTYGELDRASNQLANYLLASGIKAKDAIAIYAQRGASLVVALLGVLKAGGVFTILDPAYPAARLISYLRIARPKGWLQITGSGQLPEELSRYLETVGFECRLVLPANKTEFAEMLRDVNQAKSPFAIAANDHAYIAFTSGSTGEAKGVLCRHGSITHFLPWQTNAFGLSGNDRFALLSGLAYNHLHRDVFTALAMGASVYIPPPEITREPAQLCHWLRENSITVLHLTPALGQLLLTGAETRLPLVRRVFFGGDVLTQGRVTNTRAMAPNATIGCFYGATETQRAVGYCEIPANFAANDLDVNRPIPLGRGIEDVQLLLLNKKSKLAGIGELGELYVRSPHLAEGYVGDETLTRERFITNPFTNDPEDRLYRTGEMGRYLPDGNVEGAGRNDRRVNIRGFRIELEEIESVLRQHPTVKDAAVIMQEVELPSSETPKSESSENPKSKIENPKSDLRLMAYIAADEEQQSLADLLQSFLSNRLPSYMVPAHFVILEQLPLSPNGKVDYRALPPVRQIQTSSSSPIIAPRNEVEREISAIFCQVLARDQVGIEENFFRLGGHSLLAAQAAARIREAYGLNFELRTFLDYPTVAGLAKHIEIRIKAADTTTSTDDTDREEIEL